MARTPKLKFPKNAGRLEAVIVYGSGCYGRDLIAPIIHSIEALWHSYVVYPHLLPDRKRALMADQRAGQPSAHYRRGLAT